MASIQGDLKAVLLVPTLPLGEALQMLQRRRRRGAGATQTAFPRGAWERGGTWPGLNPFIIYLLYSDGK